MHTEYVDEKKIAVIMPVHNTPRKYLLEALESLRRQIFQKFRLICVDDQSTDKNTIEVLREYSKKYANMEVIYLKKAVGAAEARNIGLSMAREDYVIFLDSDDIFEKDFLLKMYEEITSSDAQVCVCGWNKFSDKQMVMSTWTPYIYENKEDELFLVYEHLVPWNKLCQRKLLTENNIRFQNLKSSNDVYYSICVLFDAEHICYIEEPLVKYRVLTNHQISANRDPMNLGYACRQAIECYNGSKDAKKRIQILILMLITMRAECKDDDTHDQLCQYMRDNILDYIICEDVENRTIKKLLLLIQNDEYTLSTAKSIFSFENQINDHRIELINKLMQPKPIFLWGVGKRGKAFLKFCKENSIKISAVADSNNTNIGKIDCFGNKIISIDDMLNKKGLIVASNNNIYECIRKYRTEQSALNLQQYCPFFDIM